MGLQQTLKALADPIRREILNLLKKGRMPGRRDYCAFFCIRAGDFPAPVGAEGGGPDPRHPGGKVYLL